MLSCGHCYLDVLKICGEIKFGGFGGLIENQPNMCLIFGYLIYDNPIYTELSNLNLPIVDL